MSAMLTLTVLYNKQLLCNVCAAEERQRQCGGKQRRPAVHRAAVLRGQLSPEPFNTRVCQAPREQNAAVSSLGRIRDPTVGE